MPKPLLQIIIASTRPGRVGGPVGTWFTGRAREHDGFDVEVVDLAEVKLPFLDEPRHPRFHDYQLDELARFTPVMRTVREQRRAGSTGLT
jgi:hypothetical protein